MSQLVTARRRGSGAFETEGWSSSLSGRADFLDRFRRRRITRSEFTNFGPLSPTPASARGVALRGLTFSCLSGDSASAKPVASVP